MSFFVRYVLVYAVVGVLLLGVVAYSGYQTGFGALTWMTVVALVLWLLGYHGTMLWLDYRRLAGLVADLRAGRLDQRVQPDHVRESVRYLAVRYGGVPDIVAGWLVKRIVTDELARELTARLSTAPAGARS